MKRTISTEAGTKGKTAVKESKAVRRTGAQGICSTCNNYEDCAIRARSGSPILHCEEFDDGSSDVATFSPEKEPEPEVARPETGKYTGICVNCEERHVCPRSSTEGGIWHCEEYR